MKDILKSLVVWVMIIPISILNGGFREGILKPWIGSNASLPLSRIILSVLILLLTICMLPRFAKGHYAGIGIVWVILAVAFETVMGIFTGVSFAEMVSAYNPMTGNLWSLVLLTTGISPWLSARIQCDRKQS